MTGARIGSVIGAGFGLLFVLLNTGSLPTQLAWALRAVAAAGSMAVLATVVLGGRRAGPSTDHPAGPPSASPSGAGGFTRGYWAVVAGEGVALFAGLAVINGALRAPQAAIGWVSLVVGVHFLALARVWRLHFFRVLGAAIALCGAVGLLLAILGAAGAASDLVAGVLPGGLLLGFALRGSLRAVPDRGQS